MKREKAGYVLIVALAAHRIGPARLHQRRRARCHSSPIGEGLLRAAAGAKYIEMGGVAWRIPAEEAAAHI